MGFSQEQIDTVVGILKEWDGGQIPTPLFTVIAPMIPQPNIEVVVWRVNSDKEIEVLLIPRPDGDPTWPGMLHSPGTALRSSDFDRPDQRPERSAFDRIQKGELKADFLGEPHYVSHFLPLLYKTRRSPEVVNVFVAQVAPNASLPEGARWIPYRQLDSIPEFIRHQLKMVVIAVNYIEKNLIA